MSTPPIVRVGNLPANLRNAVQTASRAAISRTGKFTVAISGGSLPRLLAAALKEADEPFDKWNVYLADERLVPYDHADSNARAIDEHLPDLRVVRADTSLTGAECAKTYEASIANDVDGGFDAVLLGLGPDGHTCSLFPNHELVSFF